MIPIALVFYFRCNGSHWRVLGVRFDVLFLNPSPFILLWIMDFGERREISKSSKQVMNEGQLLKREEGGAMGGKQRKTRDTE